VIGAVSRCIHVGFGVGVGVGGGFVGDGRGESGERWLESLGLVPE
jgi:hypothetical protein